MDFSIPGQLSEIREAVRELCQQFPGEYRIKLRVQRKKQ